MVGVTGRLRTTIEPILAMAACHVALGNIAKFAVGGI